MRRQRNRSKKAHVKTLNEEVARGPFGVRPLHPALSAPSDIDILQMLSEAISAEYWADTCKAGLVISKISHDPPIHYVAVARYHNHHMSKEVIVAESDPNFSKALRQCAVAWLAKVYRPSKEDLKRKLHSTLST